MKTVYIPAGATYNYETLVTDDVIVHGHLHVTNGSASVRLALLIKLFLLFFGFIICIS